MNPTQIRTCCRALARGLIVAAALGLIPQTVAQTRPPLPVPGAPGTPGVRDPGSGRLPATRGFQRRPATATSVPGNRHTGHATIDRIVGTCFRPGDIVSASGRSLAGTSPFSRGKAYLVSSGTRIPLEIVNRTETTLILKLPGSRPASSGPWRIALPASTASLTPTPLGPDIRFCPSLPDAGSAAAGSPDRAPEILLALRTTGTAALAPLFTGDIDALAADLTGRGFTIIERISFDGIGLVTFRLVPPPQTDLDAAATILRQAYPAATVDFNHIYSVAAGPRRYAATAIGMARPQHSCPATTSSLRIGILDSGIDLDHPALQGARFRVTEKSFIAAKGGPDPGNHGTAVAALLAGDSADPSFSGLLWENTIFAAEVLRETGSGTTGTAHMLLAGLNWLSLNNTDIAVLALSGRFNRVVELGLTGAADRGMVLVAAAGNQGPRKPVAFPASSKWVYAISAIDAEENLYERANRGPEIAFVAPGVDIWVARKGGGGLYRSGTSFAAPHAAAAIATYLDTATRRDLSGVTAISARDALRRRIASDSRDLGTPSHDDSFGWGLLQAKRCT